MEEDYINEGIKIFNSLDKKTKIKILLLSGLALFIGIIKLIIRSIKPWHNYKKAF